MKNKHIKKGWKIIRDGGSYCRARARTVKYSAERCTKPRKRMGPLCVFGDLRSAQLFNIRFSSGDIKECLYVPSKLKYIWDGHSSNHILDLPPGTVLANRVRLLEN